MRSPYPALKIGRALRGVTSRRLGLRRLDLNQDLRVMRDEVKNDISFVWCRFRRCPHCFRVFTCTQSCTRAVRPPQTSVPVNQEAESSRNRDRIWTGFLCSGSRRRTKIRCGQVEVVGLWIEPHRFGPELCLHALDFAELVGRIFMEYMDYTFARRNVQQTR